MRPNTGQAIIIAGAIIVVVVGAIIIYKTGRLAFRVLSGAIMAVAVSLAATLVSNAIAQANSVEVSNKIRADLGNQFPNLKVIGSGKSATTTIGKCVFMFGLQKVADHYEPGAITGQKCWP